MTRVLLVLSALLVFATPALAQDPVKAAPKNYSIVFENDQVRVLRAILAAGEKVPAHDHPNTVVVPLTEGVGRFTVAGKSQDQKMTAGTPLWIPAENHAVENTGKARVEVLVIELKSAKK